MFIAKKLKKSISNSKYNIYSKSTNKEGHNKIIGKRTNHKKQQTAKDVKKTTAMNLHNLTSIKTIKKKLLFFH